MLLTALVLSTEPSLSKAVWVGQETEFLLRFLLLIVAGLTVHAGANLTNTYYDYAAEVDGTQADDRTILDGHLSAQSVKNLSWACYGCSALAWAALIKMGGVPLLCVTLGGGFLGWAYTAKPFSLK
jgi:1,4-dihydroxy-2-naphthoate octaprenyltransferase